MIKKIYVASPFNGEESNVVKAIQYCRYVFEKGYIPIAPHLLFPRFLNDSDNGERAFGMFAAIELLKICDEMWVFGNHSFGVCLECLFAEMFQIPILHIDMDVFDANITK